MAKRRVPDSNYYFDPKIAEYASSKRPQLLNYARKLGAPDGQDLLQEAVLHLARAGTHVDNAKGSAAALIIAAMKTAHLDALRAQRAVSELHENMPGPDSFSEVEKSLDFEGTLSSVGFAPFTIRIATLIAQGWTHKDIAKQLSIPIGTLRSTWNRERKRLRNRKTTPLV